MKNGITWSAGASAELFLKEKMKNFRLRQKLSFFAVEICLGRLYPIHGTLRGGGYRLTNEQEGYRMSQDNRQDPMVLIRMQLEKAWDAGDLPLAMHMSRMVDQAMVSQLQEREPERRQAQ